MKTTRWIHCVYHIMGYWETLGLGVGWVLGTVLVCFLLVYTPVYIWLLLNRRFDKKKLAEEEARRKFHRGEVY